VGTFYRFSPRRAIPARVRRGYGTHPHPAILDVCYRSGRSKRPRSRCEHAGVVGRGDRVGRDVRRQGERAAERAVPHLAQGPAVLVLGPLVAAQFQAHDGVVAGTDDLRGGVKVTRLAGKPADGPKAARL